MSIIIRESVYRGAIKTLRVVGLLVIAPIIIIIGFAVWHSIPESGFGPENIERVKASMHESYKQKNMEVIEINLLRENKQKLSGYVVVRIPGVAEPVQKTCTATMDDKFEKFIWSCG